MQIISLAGEGLRYFTQPCAAELSAAILKLELVMGLQFTKNIPIYEKQTFIPLRHYLMNR